jgi:hypothetical protein
MISSVLAFVIYFIFFTLIVHSVLADPRLKEKARRSLGKSLILFCLIICAVSLSFANDAAVSGTIINVDWPNLNVPAPDLLTPSVTIKNTGAPTSLGIRFSIQDPKDKWYYGACSSTGVLRHDKRATVWPSGIQITESMLKGTYNARMELFANNGYCTDILSTVTKKFSFNVR